MVRIAKATINEASHGEFRRDAAALGAANTIRNSCNDPKPGTSFIRNRRKVFVVRPAASFTAKAGSGNDVTSSILADSFGQISDPDPAQFLIAHRQIYGH
jgi:hypothetical protein